MQIIPVIDLKNGIAVHAKQGRRERYEPLKSILCQSADLLDIIETLNSRFGFCLFYIADLNALMHEGDNNLLISRAITSFPRITFWIDSGYPLVDSGFRQHSNYVPVLGSESFRENNISDIKKFENAFILSLDFSANEKMGAKSLFEADTLWPERIIIMSLAKVGSNQGPDFEKLTSYSRRYPRKKIIAAGGIRHIGDLNALKRLGIDQTLIATALHSGNLTLDDIVNLQAKKYPG